MVWENLEDKPSQSGYYIFLKFLEFIFYICCSPLVSSSGPGISLVVNSKTQSKSNFRKSKLFIIKCCVFFISFSKKQRQIVEPLQLSQNSVIFTWSFLLWNASVASYLCMLSISLSFYILSNMMPALIGLWFLPLMFVCELCNGLWLIAMKRGMVDLKTSLLQTETLWSHRIPCLGFIL